MSNILGYDPPFHDDYHVLFASAVCSISENNPTVLISVVSFNLNTTATQQPSALREHIP